MRFPKLERVYDILFQSLIIFLPFYVLVTVFLKYQLEISFAPYIKEWILSIMGLCVLVYKIYTKTSFSKIDIAIGAYILYLVVLSIFSTGFNWIVYGWRYDFEFLIAFLIAYHGSSLLTHKISYYLKLFLLSWGLAIAIGVLIRFFLGEDILLHVWFSWNPSTWQTGSSVPIFHGIDGANVRRFQWIFDGPNTTAAFLIFYTSVLVYYFRNKKDWHFFLGMVIFFLAGLIFLTYSRSGMIAFIGSIGVVSLFYFKTLFTRYKLQLISVIVIFITLFWLLFLRYGWVGNGAVTVRPWSSQWHLERMITGMNFFFEKPWWHGLWFAGPAYRYLHANEVTDGIKIDDLDKKYIPESWYIQQLVEWGVVAFILFLSILYLISQGLFRYHPFLFGGFFGILVMNFFLHTFESTYLSLLVFLIAGLVIGRKSKQNSRS